MMLLLLLLGGWVGGGWGGRLQRGSNERCCPRASLTLQLALPHTHEHTVPPTAQSRSSAAASRTPSSTPARRASASRRCSPPSRACGRRRSTSRRCTPTRCSCGRSHRGERGGVGRGRGAASCMTRAELICASCPSPRLVNPEKTRRPQHPSPPSCLLARVYNAAEPLLDADAVVTEPGRTAVTATDVLLRGYYGGIVAAGETSGGRRGGHERERRERWGRDSGERQKQKGGGRVRTGGG